jgi:hypothetical protein
MHGDAVAARAFASGSCGDEIRLGIRRVEGKGLARLPEGGDVIDVDAEVKHLGFRI